MSQKWAGRVENLIVTKENGGTDWVIVRLSNNNPKAPEWYALELSHRTPTSMAVYNLLRDAMKSEQAVRLVVNRNKSAAPDWQEAIILAVESPRLPPGHTKRFIGG